MKIAIHGATNLSNFGDILFAHLFYDTCSDCGNDTYFYSGRFYGIGSFCRKELAYDKRCNILQFLNADALIMMSGGYFGEDKQSIKNTISRYLRFFLPARIFQITGKPIYVLGIGGGPLYSHFLQCVAKKIIDYAKIVYVRDQETKDYFIQYGCKNNIVVTADTALNISAASISNLENHMDLIEKIDSSIVNDKILLFHVLVSPKEDEKISEVIVPALNRFLKEHDGYTVVFCTDGLYDGDLANLNSYKRLICGNKKIYKYTNSLLLCQLINRAEFIITMKLHVGIIGASFGKSVVSFPIHREKVARFYNQIGEKGRTIRLDDCDITTAYTMMNNYYKKPICISESIRNDAKKNLSIITEI